MAEVDVVLKDACNDEIPSPLRQGNLKKIEGYYFETHVKDELLKFKNKLYVRVNAKQIKFTNISFEHCIFESCYFKNCVFDCCSFVGCKFVGCQLPSSKFVRCDFRYVSFERTIVDGDILKACPEEDNLKMRFARTLRINFQQIGDANSVNRAISLELSATNSYLFKSCFSGEEYYVKKYGGVRRCRQFASWLQFKFLDIVWGNGESVYKLIRAIFILLSAICFFTMQFDGVTSWENLPNAFVKAAALFFGSLSFEKANFPELLSSSVIACRFILFALLTSILVKRLGRR